MLPSVILVNGSFGVGKTSVTREIRRRVQGSAIYDPELAGLVMQRLCRLAGRKVGDFQDLALWRRSVAAGVRLSRALARGPVLVPMTFSSVDYLSYVLSGIRAFEPDVRVFCLTASLDTIRGRIRHRGDAVEGPTASWMLRRTEECVRAHEDPRFGERVDTEGRSVNEVADRILTELKR